MTRPFTGTELLDVLRGRFPEATVEVQQEALVLHREALSDVCAYLKQEPSLAFNFLTSLTTVDYLDYFEGVYRLVSLSHNHSAVLKARAYGREDPWLPSVVSLWLGADLQEREAWDLMGVRFEGHPNLRRIMMWEGYPAHPLRKDFMQFDHRTFALPATSDHD